MSDYISINVQETEPAQSIHHSARTKTVTYLVANPHTITNYRHDLTSLNTNPNEIENIKDYFNVRKDEISQDYKQHIKQTMKSNTKLYQEAVISFGRERFEQNNQADILKATEDFCLEFEQKYNVKILMTSLHLDEGHKDENGTIQHNYHTHLLIENYSFDTHKTGMRKVDYRKLQTDLAKSFEHLGFVRGDPEKKAQRLEHREYRATKEQEAKLASEIEAVKSELASVEQVKEQYKQARQELKDSGIAKQADYQELKKQYAELEQKAKEQNLTLKKLEEAIKPLEQFVYSDDIFETLGFATERLKHLEEDQKKINERLEEPLQKLKQEVFNSDELKHLEILSPLGYVVPSVDRANKKIQDLKQENDKLEKENKTNSKNINIYRESINYYMDKKTELETQLEQLKTKTMQTPTLTQEKPIEREKTISMEELKPLERVIGAFASVGELVERLIEKITNLTKTTENLKLELKELHEENEDLKEELKEYKDNEIEFER